jgi:hypothetical protein
VEASGEKMTQKEIEKWLKQSITVPETYHELIDQVNVFVKGIEILGGDTNFTANKVQHFAKVLAEQRKRVEGQIVRNKETAAYILFQMGLKVNNYLTELENAKDLEDVPRGLLNFDILKEKIMSWDMTPILPPIFKKIKAPKRDLEGGDDDEDTPAKMKRRGQGEKHGGAVVVRCAS